MFLYFPVLYLWIFQFSFFTAQNVGSFCLTVVCGHVRSTNVTVEMYKHVS
jgi:hypothetical protein